MSGSERKTNKRHWTQFPKYRIYKMYVSKVQNSYNAVRASSLQLSTTISNPGLQSENTLPDRLITHRVWILVSQNIIALLIVKS
jgi:hypothetical protein